MLKSKKGKKGSDEAEEYPLMSTAPIVQEGSQIQNTTAIPPVVMMSSSNAADMTITSKADKKSRKRSKAVSGKY